MNQPSASPSPGWYPDPHGGSQLRWFNGTDWADPAPQPAQRRFTIHYGFALLALFSLCGTLFFGIPMLVSGANSETGIGFGLGILWMLWGGMWTVIWAAFATQHTLKGRSR